MNFVKFAKLHSWKCNQLLLLPKELKTSDVADIQLQYLNERHRIKTTKRETVPVVSSVLSAGGNYRNLPLA